MSFFKDLTKFPNDLDEVDFYFHLFDQDKKGYWSQGDFAEAMRVLLEGVYISDYEDRVIIPSDCDPAEKEKEDLENNEFLDIGELERKNEAEKKNIQVGLIEQYLQVLFKDVDIAKMGNIDLDDFQE